MSILGKVSKVLGKVGKVLDKVGKLVGNNCKGLRVRICFK
jgi:hypothetical protein